MSEAFEEMVADMERQELEERESKLRRNTSSDTPVRKGTRPLEGEDLHDDDWDIHRGDPTGDFTGFGFFLLFVMFLVVNIYNCHTTYGLRNLGKHNLVGVCPEFTLTYTSDGHAVIECETPDGDEIYNRFMLPMDLNATKLDKLEPFEVMRPDRINFAYMFAPIVSSYKTGSTVFVSHSDDKNMDIATYDEFTYIVSRLMDSAHNAITYSTKEEATKVTIKSTWEGS
ncbi:hypothetical protein [Vibrio crassostreae]|uniref:hypothetical protein n=1 Tax=Vibrio crassostreae TaxID=246167 RepID=UPI001B30CCF8|nr:hypothetical protein [Vibrio crassostreae]